MPDSIRTSGGGCGPRIAPCRLIPRYFSCDLSCQIRWRRESAEIPFLLHHSDQHQGDTKPKPFPSVNRRPTSSLLWLFSNRVSAFTAKAREKSQRNSFLARNVLLTSKI